MTGIGFISLNTPCAGTTRGGCRSRVGPRGAWWGPRGPPCVAWLSLSEEAVSTVAVCHVALLGGGCRRARGYPSGHRSPLSHAAAGETLRPLSRAAALLRSARVRPTPRRCDKPFVMGNPHNKPRQDHKQIIFSSYYDYRCQPASGSGASTVRRGRGGGGRISLAVARALLPATFAGRERTHTPEGRQYRFDSSLAPNVLPVAAASYSKLTPFPRCVSSCVQATNAWHWVRARRSSEGPSG